MELREWEDWIRQDETQAFFAAVHLKQEQIKNEWANGSYDSTDAQAVFYVQSKLMGLMQAFRDIEEIRYEDYLEWTRV